MRRFITLLLLLVLLGAANRSSAQFSISRVTPKEIDTKAMDDTIKPIAPINNRFFSEARYKAERRAIRKERNTLQINASAMFNLTGFSKYWAAGGQDVFATNLAFYFSHAYIKNKFNFQTTFDARYGINHIDGKNFKNEDAFVFNLSSSWELNKNWSYAATFQYRSQFSNGYKSREDNTLVSAFMAPGTIAPAIGFIYRNKKVPLTDQHHARSRKRHVRTERQLVASRCVRCQTRTEKHRCDPELPCNSISTRHSITIKSLTGPIFMPFRTTTATGMPISTGKIPYNLKYSNLFQPRCSVLPYTTKQPVLRKDGNGYR